MPSFGQKLKSEREKRKLSLDEISATTKISTRMLHALEEDKFGQLPGGIFNKGFVRAYARTVGLDEDQTISDYLEASGEAPPRAEPGFRENAFRDNVRDNARDNSHNNAPDNSSHSVPLRITDEPSGRLEIRAEVASRQLPWGMFAVVLLIIALALSLWTNRRREQEREAGHAPAATQHDQSHAPTDASPSSDTTGSTSPTGSGSPTDSPAANQRSASDAVHSASDLTPEKSSAASAQSSDSSATSLAPGEFAVTVRAREESWLSISIDGKHTASEVLEPGDERTLRARTDVVLKAGNSAGVDVLLNGRRLETPGESGAVKTFTIGPSGVIPTASPANSASAPSTNP